MLRSIRLGVALPGVLTEAEEARRTGVLMDEPGLALCFLVLDLDLEEGVLRAASKSGKLSLAGSAKGNRTLTEDMGLGVGLGGAAGPRSGGWGDSKDRLG